jgi:hypothetical protein
MKNHSTKDNDKRLRKQVMDLEKIFAKGVSDKGCHPKYTKNS